MTTTRFDLVTIPRTGSGGSSRFWGGLAKLLPWKRGALMAFFLSTRIFSHAGSQPMPVAANPDSTIVKFADTYRKAVLAEEAAGLLALYREDAIEMPPFQPTIVGRAAIEQFYRRTFQGPGKSDRVHVQPHGNHDSRRRCLRCRQLQANHVRSADRDDRG
jgi:hypothetical protein